MSLIGFEPVTSRLLDANSKYKKIVIKMSPMGFEPATYRLIPTNFSLKSDKKTVSDWIRTFDIGYYNYKGEQKCF